MGCMCMSKDIESHIRIKEIIFNEKQYSKTKKSLAIFYIVVLAYFRVAENHNIISGTWIAIGIIGGIIYTVSKIIFYNEGKKIKDILLLILLFGLLIWGVYILKAP